MDTRELRIVFVMDAIAGRNGVGTYFQDLAAQLTGRVASVALISPQLGEPHPCQGASLPMPGDPTQRLFLPKLGEMTRIILEHRPHVIVIPGPGLFSLAASWIAARMGIPLCVTHQTDYNSLANLYWRGSFAKMAKGLLTLVNRWLFQRAAAVATISEPMQQQLRLLGISHPHLVGTPLAPPFVQTSVIPVTGSVRRILFVGRLAAEKNIEHFLALSQQRPDLEFTIAGDGPLRDLVERQMAGQSNLRFLGWCPRETIVAAVDQHDLLILPSAVEAFGTVALEAMARRRLVMVTPACGINQWPALAEGLFVMRPDESLMESVARLEALPELARWRMAMLAEQAARAINEQCLGQWLQVLRIAARQRCVASSVLPSPAFALLRRRAMSGNNG